MISYNLCKSIEMQIDDEKKAVGEYYDLSKLMKAQKPGSDGYALAIEGIAQDEQKHHDMLIKIKRKFC